VDIEFCEGCDGSISRREVEEGRVVRVGGRLWHRACAPGPRRRLLAWLPWALLAPLAAAGFLLGRGLAEPETRDEPPVRDAPTLQRLGELETEIRGLSAQVEAASERAAARSDVLVGDLDAHGAALRAYGEDLATLGDALGALVSELAAPPRTEPAEDDGEALARLLADAASPEFGVRWSAMRGLFLRPETEATEALRRALADPDRRVRAYAARLLGERGDRDVAGELVTLLLDEEPLVRQAAHRALLLLSGMPFPYDAVAPEEERREQAASWERWWRETENK
jgi:hypothetical protein